jgi:hypothetical protein
MRQEGWGPGNGLKGRKSNKPTLQNQAVQHKVIDKAEFHTIVNQFHPPLFLQTASLRNYEGYSKINLRLAG